MTDLELTYDGLIEELNAKVAEAIKALNEAKEIADKASINPRSFSDWNDIKDAVKPFFDVDGTDIGWSSSSWCAGD